MKDDRYYLLHMVEHSQKVLDSINGLNKEQLLADEVKYTAVLHWLQIIGEAATNISATLQAENPNVPWRAMTGMRNRIVHDYLGIDQEVVWKTIRNDLPNLLVELNRILDDS